MELDSGDGCKPGEYTEITELSTFKNEVKHLEMMSFVAYELYFRRKGEMEGEKGEKEEKNKGSKVER